MIVSGFTSFTENWVICCHQITKVFCTKYGSANASSARDSCNVGLPTDLAISIFWEVRMGDPLFSKAWAQKTVHEKIWRVSFCVQELYHPREFFWILAVILGFRNKTCLTVLIRGLRFLFGFGFLLDLVNGSFVLAFQYVHLTQILDRNLSRSGFPVL